MTSTMNKRKRPLSHRPLVNFPKDDNFLYSDPKFMNDELWKRKYNLTKLHERWKRKAQINFLDIDFKFGIPKHKKKAQSLYDFNKNKMNQSQQKIINLYSSIFYRKREKKYYDKYDDKISYYLNNKNPWNIGTVIDKHRSDDYAPNLKKKKY